MNRIFPGNAEADDCEGTRLGLSVISVVDEDTFDARLGDTVGKESDGETVGCTVRFPLPGDCVGPTDVGLRLGSTVGLAVAVEFGVLCGPCVGLTDGWLVQTSSNWLFSGSSDTVRWKSAPSVP